MSEPIYNQNQLTDDVVDSEIDLALRELKRADPGAKAGFYITIKNNRSIEKQSRSTATMAKIAIGLGCVQVLLALVQIFIAICGH